MGNLLFWARVRGNYRRTSARVFYRRPFVIKSDVPIVSFTFDDFPRSALHTGGSILRHYGATGTYYAAFGLMGKQAPTGTMFVKEDLESLLKEGHELGCHTFGHCDAAETSPGAFEESIIENQKALTNLYPGLHFRTLSYPLNAPRARTKQKVARHFACARGGGQTFNKGTADLNCLLAHFLEQSRDNPQGVKSLIDANCRTKGWLIFATHDISEDPTPWGCTPGLFEDIVRHTVRSGTRILSVQNAYDALRGIASRMPNCNSQNHKSLSEI